VGLAADKQTEQAIQHARETLERLRSDLAGRGLPLSHASLAQLHAERPELRETAARILREFQASSVEATPAETPPAQGSSGKRKLGMARGEFTVPDDWDDLPEDVQRPLGMID